MFRNLDWSFSSSAETMTGCVVAVVVIMLIAVVI